MLENGQILEVLTESMCELQTYHVNFLIPTVFVLLSIAKCTS